MHDSGDEIRLNLCPKCPGQPVVLIMPNWPYPMVGVVCSKCGHAGPKIYFTNEDTIFHGQDRVMLPGLATARRQAAAAWNEEPAERWNHKRGVVI